MFHCILHNLFSYFPNWTSDLLPSNEFFNKIFFRLIELITLLRNRIHQFEEEWWYSWGWRWWWWWSRGEQSLGTQLCWLFISLENVWKPKLFRVHHIIIISVVKGLGLSIVSIDALLLLWFYLFITIIRLIGIPIILLFNIADFTLLSLGHNCEM